MCLSGACLIRFRIKIVSYYIQIVWDYAHCVLKQICKAEIHFPKKTYHTWKWFKWKNDLILNEWMNERVFKET